MKKLSVLLAVVTAVIFAGCGPKRSQAYYDQPSQVMSATAEGTYIIRVQVRAKDAVVAFKEAQRKVVKEVIFDGVKSANGGISDLKPLCFDMTKVRGASSRVIKTAVLLRLAINAMAV